MAEIQSSCAETGRDAWGVIQAKPQRPLSAHALGSATRMCSGLALNLRQTGPRRGLDAAGVWSREKSRGSPLLMHAQQQWVQNVQRLGTESWADRAWQEYTLVCFCELRALQLLHSTPQLGAESGVNRSWEKFATVAAQDLSGSTATSTCSHSMLVPTPAYSTPQPCTRSGKNIKHNRQREATLGYFWAELQTPAWVTHRFAVTTQASHASTALPLGQGMHSKAKEPD